MFKKKDIIIFFVIFAAAAVSFLFFFSNESGKRVKITENNKVVYEGSLSKNKKIELKSNTVLIENSKVKMQYSDCKNQICVHHKPISKKGESIICLPNRVTAEIE